MSKNSPGKGSGGSHSARRGTLSAKPLFYPVIFAKVWD
jgi:hypothetical protein